jgi:hypothetical protein
MKYIVITEVDHDTRIPCTVEPQRTGPSMPVVKGWIYLWSDSSTWPVEVASDGTYLKAPKYYGTCDNDADTSIAGVLEVLTEAEYNQRKYDEFYARQPYPSWIWNSETLTWFAPVPYPNDGNNYYWDENTLSWVKIN